MYGKCNVHIGLRTALIMNFMPVTRNTCISYGERNGICGRKDELEGKAFNWPHRVFLQQAYEPPCKAVVGALVLIFKKKNHSCATKKIVHQFYFWIFVFSLKNIWFDFEIEWSCIQKRFIYKKVNFTYQVPFSIRDKTTNVTAFTIL